MRYRTEELEMVAVTFSTKDNAGFSQEQRTVFYDEQRDECFVSVPEDKFFLVSEMRAEQVAYIVHNGQVFAPFSFLGERYAYDREIVEALDHLAKQTKGALDSGFDEYHFFEDRAEEVR